MRSTGTSVGSGFFGDVMEVARGSTRCIAKKFRNADKEALTTVFGEDSILCKIRHPNIVAYCGVCTLANDKSTVVVMERMDMNLSSFLKEGDVSKLEKFHILHDVIQGLNHLHTLTPAIVHRDLNERNVLVNSKGVAKVGDFGNYRLVSPELPSTTGVANLDYMPPEASDDSDIDDKLDVFSFGHLAIYIVNQSAPHPLLRHNYVNEDKCIGRSEVERRTKYLDLMNSKLEGGDRHPLFPLITSCLHDEPIHRPSCEDILQSGIFSDSKCIT